jgi:PRC-barrel domain
MHVLRLCLAIAYLLVWDRPATAADPQPGGQAEQAPPLVEHVPAEEALAILGSPVAAPDGKAIGRLVDVLVDSSGTPQAAVIDVGGFMGVGARKIAVHWSVLHFAPANPKQPITLDLTLDQIKAAPEYPNPPKPAPVVLPVKAAGETGGGETSGSGTPGSAATGSGTAGSGTAGSGTAGSGTAGGGTAGGGTTGSGTPSTTPTGSSPTGSTATGTTPTGSAATGSAATGSTATGSTATGSTATGSTATGSTPTGSGATGNATTGSGTTGSGTTGGEPARQTTPPRPQ